MSLQRKLVLLSAGWNLNAFDIAFSTAADLADNQAVLKALCHPWPPPNRMLVVNSAKFYSRCTLPLESRFALEHWVFMPHSGRTHRSGAFRG